MHNDIKKADNFLVSAKLCPEEQETLRTVLAALSDQEAGVLEIGGTNYLVSKSVTNPLEWNLMIFTNYDRMISKLTQKIYLRILFKEKVGINFKDYVLQYKMRRAKQLLCSSNIKMSKIAEELGYMDMKNFSRAFKSYTGQAPSEYRNQIREEK